MARRERRKTTWSRSAAPANARCCRSARPAPGQNGTGRVVLAEHVGAVDGEQLREPRAGTIDPAFDCPHRGLADGRGLLMGEACRPDENERFALVRQQRVASALRNSSNSSLLLEERDFRSLGDVKVGAIDRPTSRARLIA